MAKLNFVQLTFVAFTIATTIQQIQTEMGPGNGTAKRAEAVKRILTALTPLIPRVKDDPAVVEHIGVVIDDLIRLGHKTA